MSCMFERILALAAVAREVGVGACVRRDVLVESLLGTTASVVGAATGGWSWLASTAVAATGASVGGAMPSSTGTLAGAARGAEEPTEAAEAAGVVAASMWWESGTATALALGASAPAMVAFSGGRGSLPQASYVTMSCMYERMLALAVDKRGMR